MVDSVDEEGNELAEVDVSKPGSLEELRPSVSSSLSAVRVVSSAYLRLLIFLPAILFPACASSSP